MYIIGSDVDEVVPEKKNRITFQGVSRKYVKKVLEIFILRYTGME